MNRRLTKTSRRGLIAFFGILCFAKCSAAELGQAAPPLQVTNWFGGGPVEMVQAPTNTIHVVVFLETWCNTCTSSLPQLVEWQEKLRNSGVQFVGVFPEQAAAVKSFLDRSGFGRLLNFPTACDSDRKTVEAYMTAFGQTIVPRAFVVDRKGMVVWHGHPLAGLDRVLQQILDGKFDLNAAKRAARAEKLQMEYFNLAATNSASAKTAKLGRDIVLDGASDPWLLNNFAWRILKDGRSEKRDVELALQASKQACESTDWKLPALLDTYALALFSNKQIIESIRMEQLAVDLCTNEDLSIRLKQSLKYFNSSLTNNP